MLESLRFRSHRYGSLPLCYDGVPQHFPNIYIRQYDAIAGSTFLTESVVPELKTSAQGASDLVMNLSGAFGGAIAGVVIATLSYGWLCALAAIPVSFLGIWSLRIVKAKR